MDPSVDLPALCQKYLSAQLAGNRREALRVVVEEGLALGVTVERLRRDVVQSAQHAIGQLWQQNKISVAQEHMATAISQVVLSRLFEEAPAEENLGKKVMIACVEGEFHDFPARMVADVLELAGFDVRYLGANVPTDSLISMMKEERPDLLALSVTMNFNVTALRQALTQIRQQLDTSVPILVGGHALSWAPGLSEECGVATCGTDSACLVSTAKKLLKASTP